MCFYRFHNITTNYRIKCQKTQKFINLWFIFSFYIKKSIFVFVKKKTLHINIVLMLAVLFATCYQSIHSFSHDHHTKSECCENSHHLTFKSSEKTFTKSDECPVCDFKFAAFLSTEILHFDFIPSLYETPYQFNSKETCITFEGNSFHLRGPPSLV